MNSPVKFVQHPDGPKIFVKELGQEVGTFLTPPGGSRPALNYHVPLNMRGPYRLDQLPYKIDLRTDAFGYVLCGGFTNAGEKCSKRAENRCPRCNIHGGRIHPLDKLVTDDQEASSNREGEALSRYNQFKAGQITVDDLDDEELASCGFRARNGRIYKPRNVPREMVTAFTKAIYERAQQELKGHTVAAAQTVAEIMLNKTIEPDIRLKAANTLLDRGLGKAPQQINLTADITGFEEVFDAIIAGPRPTIIDAEVVSDDEHGGRSDFAPDASNDGSDGYAQKAIENPSISTQLVSESPDSSNDVAPERDSGPGLADARMSARNPAILAQTVEIKPFDYDLSDKSAQIKKATQKRYASRALGVDLTGPGVPFVRERLGNGLFRHIDPDSVKVKAPQSNLKTDARKRYTLGDFT